jgi:N-acetylmuramoyl-L-alanine amidase
MCVILDNGHGNNTPGKRSPVWLDGTQLFEWEFTRDIIRLIKLQLDLKHIYNIILVPEAMDVSLTTRCNRTNLIYKNSPDSFLISVHGNAGNKPNEGTGWEVWTSIGQTESDKIASIMFESAKKNLIGWKMRSDTVDGDNDKESAFTILSKTMCPAILTENLFYDNEKDCKFMLSNEGRDIIARLHVEGIINYLQTL